MLRAIDRVLRKACGPLLIGMPLFFITVSPYNNKDEKNKNSQRRSFQDIAVDSQTMINNALGGEDDDAMTETMDPEMSLYNLYLTKASVGTPVIEAEPYKEFMAISPDIKETVTQEVTYQDLLEAYLDKVEYMIDVEKDYFNALMELDKVMVVAPTNRKAQYLRTKLKQKLKEELERVKQKRGSQKSARDNELIDIKEKALLEAEKKLLTEALVEKPYQAKVASENAVAPIAEPAVEPEPIERPVKATQEKVIKTKAADTTAETDELERPQVHRDVVIIKNSDLIRMRAQKKVVQEDDGDMIVQHDEPKDQQEVEIDRTAVDERSNGPIVPQFEEVVVEQATVVVEVEDTDDDAQQQATKQETTQQNLARRAEFFEERTQYFLLRGKSYYREENFALALISFSKAKQYDELSQQHSIEIEQLITMTRDQLENIEHAD